VIPVEEFPKFVSVDDHVIEPAHVWLDWLPARFEDQAPRVERIPCSRMGYEGGLFTFETAEEGGTDCDWWRFEGDLWPCSRVESAVGYDRSEVMIAPTTFEEMRPGCYDAKARLEDMDDAHTEVQVMFPSTFPRFCGQRFSLAQDKELGLACLQAYNDWLVEEWCGDSGGRLVPLALVPLWDPDLAAAEVARNAARGVRGIAFSEIPAYLGLPSIHTGYWNPLFAACAEAGVSVHMHIGSSSTLPRTSDDAPPLVASTLTYGNAMASMVDYLLSGVLVDFPALQLVYSEGQIGWIPYMLERLDKVWESNRAWGGVEDSVPEPPSNYFHRQIYGCFFDDEHGLTEESLKAIGTDRLLYETDYPHADSTWPQCREVAEAQMGHLDMDTITKITRGNAIELLGLEL
jgi:predicted TIM-barrel fold metal-dependent hydrolase